MSTKCRHCGSATVAVARHTDIRYDGMASDCMGGDFLFMDPSRNLYSIR